MPVYRISAEEVITYTYEVEASNPSEAMATVQANHDSDPGIEMLAEMKELVSDPYRLIQTSAYVSRWLEIDPGYPMEIDPTNGSDLPGSAIPEYWNNDKEKV